MLTIFEEKNENSYSDKSQKWPNRDHPFT